MDSLTLSSSSAIQFFSRTHFVAHKSRTPTLVCRKATKFPVLALKDDSRLDEWDKMELKFGRMIGEDPKVTLTKIMGRKLNPDLSYLEIEKLLEKRKGKPLLEDIEEVPFDFSDRKKSAKSVQGLNLVRPVRKKGTNFELANEPAGAGAKETVQPTKKASEETKSSAPDVTLQKPSRFNGDDEVNGKSSRFGLRPNLSLQMGKNPPKERFIDMTLLKKPEPLTIRPELGEENDHAGLNDDKTGVKVLRDGDLSDGRSDADTLLQRPKLIKPNFSIEREHESFDKPTHSGNIEFITENMLDISDSDYQLITAPDRLADPGTHKGSSITELQVDSLSAGKPSASPSSVTPPMSLDTVLIGKPKRLDGSEKPTDQKNKGEVIYENFKNLEPSELEKFMATSPIKERENGDWARAEELVKTGGREEVELISSSTRGFVASFGSLIGFLPYRNLAARWKFLAFESWLRKNALDPSNYRQNLGVIGKYEATSPAVNSEPVEDMESVTIASGVVTSDMKLEELLMIYEQEKIKFLSSFVGQKIKVGVILANRTSRKLIFSIKPKEKEELVEKKRALMAQLSVGDVVKCCIKKITYFGVFVEVQGIPALIHQSEVSWDSTLDPASYFKVGQIVDAKVFQLDFTLERIFLSLKEVTPDPLMEALEAVVGDKSSLDGRLQEAEADGEWGDVDSLIKELEQVDGIQSVSKGSYFLSPGLAPTFQVYLTPMFENQYKLLARAGNRVQEVFIQTSLGKEELKSVVLICTNRVE